MTRKSPAFMFYPDSWVLGTMSMSFEDQGIYLRMLCFQWANGPADADAYANACGDAYVSHVNRILKRKFTNIGGLWQNDRLEAERQKQAGKSKAAKDAANRRWGKETDADAMPKPMPEPMPKTCERNANAYADAMLSNSYSSSRTEEKEKNAASAAYPPAFEEFWTAYPANGKGRKRGKQKTLTLWKKIPATDRPALMAATANYARESDPNFIRDPERFLGASWWRDWVSPTSQSSETTGERRRPVYDPEMDRPPVVLIRKELLPQNRGRSVSA
jgi:uncharacterized protein YdaU (DUF1376 family)